MPPTPFQQLPAQPALPAWSTRPGNPPPGEKGSLPAPASTQEARRNPQLSIGRDSAGLDRRKRPRELDQTVRNVPVRRSWPRGRLDDDRRPSARDFRRRARPARRGEPQGELCRFAPAAVLARGPGRGRALLLLLRRALPKGMSDVDRYSTLHPSDRGRQPGRGGADHFRRQHHGRHVRPRLSDRDAVRGGLRARSCRRQAGQHRPSAAPCDGPDDSGRQVAV